MRLALRRRRSALAAVVAALLLCSVIRAQEAGELADTVEARQLFAEAIDKARAGDTEAAVQKLDDVVRKFPRDRWAGCALGYLGELRMRQKKCDEAIEAFRRAIRDYPKARYGNEKEVAAGSSYCIAMCYAYKGQKDQAMAVLEEALERFPEARSGEGDKERRYVDMTLLVIQAEERRKGGTMPGTEEAGKLFSEAVRIRKNAPGADEYERALRQVVEKYPADNWAGCALGHLALLKNNHGKYDEAIELYQKVMQEYPLARYGNGKLVASFAAFGVATCHYQKGEKDKALEAFRYATVAYPDVCTGDGEEGKRLSDIFLEMLTPEERQKALEPKPQPK